MSMTNKEAYKLNPDLQPLMEKQGKGFFILFQCENYVEGVTVGIPDFVDLCRHLDLVLNCRYFGICHRDEVNDKGEVEKPHFHLLLVVSSWKRVTTILDLLCDYFHVDKYVEGKENKIILNPWIGIQVANNEVACVQYLVHGTEKSSNKLRYEATEVFTNAPRLRDTYLAMDRSNPIESYLPELVEACEGSLSAILKIVPAIVLKPWLAMCNSLCLEYKTNAKKYGQVPKQKDI